mgnify:CR=1 FL=1
MKITKRQLRRIIKETILLEEPSDYYRDYKAGTISKAEYEQLVRDFEAGDMSHSSAPKSQQTASQPGKKWKGSKEELTQKVHQYLIDIKFYKGFKGRDGNMYVDPFSKPTGSNAHPLGGYTSSIPKVLKDGIASGEIDWATYDEMYPVYREIDKSID